MGIERADNRSAIGVLSSALAVAGVAGAGVAVGLGIWISLANDLGPADGLLLFLYLTLLYGVVFTVGAGGVALALLVLGVRPPTRAFVALVLGFIVFLNGVLRYSPAIQLLSVVPGMSLIGAVDLLVVAMASMAVVAAFFVTSRGRRIGSVAACALLLGGLQAFHLWHEQPRHFDLARRIPPLLEIAPAAPLPPAPDRFDDAKLVVLGFDGLAWEVVIALLERGELPNFSRLLAGAAYGESATLSYPISPVIWETISSGQRPERHGIGHHFHFEFRGMSERVRVLPTFRLANSPMGIRRLLSAIKRVAPWRTVPASSEDARAARLWEIASRNGIDVGVYNWMNATPASPVRGFLHGHGVHEPIDFPVDLESTFAGMPRYEPTRWTEEEHAPEVIAHNEGVLWDRFLLLTQRFHPQLLMYYTHFGDAVNHGNWQLEVMGPGIFYCGFRHPDFQPGEMSVMANRVLDRILGDVLARLPEDATLAVISDHGFEFRGYEHDNSPPGVFILRGPGIAPGAFEGASVYDVAPTLLHVLGLPVADDMAGRPIEPALMDRPVEHVASYGPALDALARGEIDPDKLKEYEDYLRSLGYVVD